MSGEISDITLVIKVITDSTQVDKLTSSMTKMEKQTQNAALANTKLSKSISPLQTHFATLSDKLGAAERKMDAVFRAGVHMQAMGRDLMGVGRDLMRFAQDMVSTYADYDFVLRQTSLALNTNTFWHEKLDKAIQSTAITLGKFSPTEVAKAYRIWGAATGDVVDSTESLARVTKTVSDIMMTTAMVGGTLETNLQGVYAVTKQYNLGIDKASYVTQVLALLTERTALNFGDLASAFVYTGSAIGNIGGKFEDTAQVLGILADAGYRGTKAGRGLSMVFEAFLTPLTERAKDALNGLAKAASGGTKNWADLITPIKNGKRHFIGIRETVEKLATAMKNMGPVERQQAINSIFTNNAARAMLPVIQSQISLWEKQAAAGQKLTSVFDEQKYSLKGAATFYTAMSKSFSESFDSVIGSFSNSFFPLIQMVAVEIMKFAGPIMTQVKTALKELTSFLEKNPAFTEVAVKIGAIAAVVLTLAGAFLVALGTLAFFYSNIILLGAGLVPLLTLFAGLAVAFTAFTVKVATNAGGITDALANIADSLKRVFDIMTGGDAGSGLKDLAATINSIADAALGVVADAINAVADALDRLTPEQIKMIRDIALALLAIIALNRGLGLVATIIGGIASSLMTLGTAGGAIGLLGRLILPLVSGFIALAGVVWGVLSALGVIAFIASPIGIAIGIIAAAVAAFVLAYQTNFAGFRTFVDGLVAWFSVVLPAAINTALTAIGTIVAGILAPITENLPKIQAFIGDIVNQLATVWLPILQNLADTAATMFGNALAALQEVAASVMEHVQPMVDEIMKLVSALVDFLGPAWNALVVIVGAAAGAIIKTVVMVVNFIGPFINGLVDFLMRIWGTGWEFMVRIIGNFVTLVVDYIKGFVQLIRGIIEVFTGILTGNWKKVWDGLGTIVSGFVTIVGTLIRGVITLIQDVVRAGLGVLTGIFETVFGLKPGSIIATIGGFISTFMSKISTFVSGIVGKIDNIPGKMVGIGKDIVEGLWKGIQSLAGWIANKVGNLITQIIPGPIRDALGINSPSKVMAALGVNIMEGLAMGISNTDDAYNAMVAQANAISGAATGAFNDASSSLAGSQLNFVGRTSGERTINLNVDVTSGDGSVNSVGLETLSDLITGSDMVRSLERMATVE